MKNLGYIDLAGDGPIHIKESNTFIFLLIHLLGGTLSLISAKIVGPRIGRNDPE